MANRRYAVYVVTTQDPVSDERDALGTLSLFDDPQAAIVYFEWCERHNPSDRVVMTSELE